MPLAMPMCGRVQDPKRRRRRSPCPAIDDDTILEDIHAVEARSEAPTDVLDRDQRTVRVAVVEASRTRRRTNRTPTRRTRAVVRPSVQCQCEQQRVPCPVCDSARPPQCRICECGRCSSSTSSSRSSSSSSSSSSCFPAGSAIRWFLTALCVLALLPPRTMSAPTQHRPEQWINPCGAKQDAELETEEDLNQPTFSDLVQRVSVPAGNNLLQANNFREEYVKQTFNVGFDYHHNLWKTYNFGWLPEIPKQLGEKVAEEHLRKQDFDKALSDIYQNMQKYAVGMEQIVWDQKEEGGEFSKHFVAVEAGIKRLLCELQVVMAERGVVQHPDVSRDIMSREDREYKEKSERSLRDWLILRDYMNALEYVIQLMETFQNNPQPQ